MANPYEPEELSTESDSEDNILNRFKRIVPSSGGDESLRLANKERGAPSFMKSAFYGFKPESGQQPAAEPARSNEPAESAASGDRTAMLEALRALQRTRRRQPVVPYGAYPEKQSSEGTDADDVGYASGEPPAGEGRSYPPAGADEDVRRMGFAPATITGSRAASKSEPSSESATKTPAMEGAGGDEPSVLPGYGLPYLVSRMTEQMRTARTGGTRDYSAAQHILNLRAQSEQAPILAEQRRRAEEDRMTKQKLDAARLLVEQKRAEAAGKTKSGNAGDLTFEQYSNLTPEQKQEYDRYKGRKLVSAIGKPATARVPANGSTSQDELAGLSKADRDEGYRIQKSVKPELANALSAIEEIERTDPIGNKIGVFDKMLLALPKGIGSQYVDPATRDEAAKRKVFEQFIRRVESGLTLSKQELEESRSKFGTDIFDDPKQFNRMMDFYKTTMQKQLAANQAMFGDNIKSLYLKRGGYTADHPMFRKKLQSDAQANEPMSLKDVISKRGEPPQGKVWVIRNGKLGTVSNPLPTDEVLR